jgi:hypothetical protein
MAAALWGAAGKALSSVESDPYFGQKLFPATSLHRRWLTPTPASPSSSRSANTSISTSALAAPAWPAPSSPFLGSRQREGRLAPLGQAAPLIAALPYGGVQEVLPRSDLTPSNATARLRTRTHHHYSASQLFSGMLYGNKGFTSALWLNPSPDSSYVLGFGIDTALTVKRGWDNATGYGTLYRLAFLDAVTAAQQ